MNMNLSINKLLLAGVLALTFMLSGCHHYVSAVGTVKDAETGDPIEGAHIVIVALLNQSEEVIDELYTDSLGHFDNGGDLMGYGLKRVKFYLIFEKDSFRTAISEYPPVDFFDIRLQKLQ